MVVEPVERWVTQDASDLYDVPRWGKGYFSISKEGTLLVHPNRNSDQAVDMKELVDRLTNPVKRLLSGFGDYLAWTITLLPLLTGYLAVNHLLLEYTLMLAIHILSVSLLLALLPFTKLFHTFSAFASRWYNGNIFGRKGVAS